MPFKYNALLGLGLDNTIPLDGAGKIPSTFLPSYVDDVEEYNNLAAFPATGETGKIYVAIDTGFVYRWSGSVYVQIGITAAAGSTTQVQFNDGGAFGGDDGLVFNKTTNALTVAGPATAASIIPTSSTVPANGIYLPAANSVAVATNGTQRLSIDSAGITRIGSGTTGLFLSPLTGSSAYLVTDVTTSATQLRVGTSTAIPLVLTTSDTERLRVTSAGLVGIGISSPSFTAHVSGTKNTSQLFIDAPTISAANDYAQIGFGIGGTSFGLVRLGFDNPAGVTNSYLSFHNNSGSSNVERMRIDSSGRLLVGTSTARENFDAQDAIIAPQFQIEGTSAAQTSFAIIRNAAGASSYPRIYLAKTRATSIGSNTVVASGDDLGELLFNGADGTNLIEAASVKAQVDGTPGANDMPGRIIFSTTADGAASPTERLRITSAGVIQVADAGNIAVGTTTGTKIGTATTQKLGFYNATPVVQPAAVANATTAIDVITQLNDLLAKLRTLGIIAT